MSSANGGHILFHFKGDDSDLTKKTNSLSSKLGGLGSTLGKSLMVGAAVGTAAITGLVATSVKAYGEFEQLEGGLEALFGKGSAEMQRVLKDSENAYKDLTMSQNEYLKAFETSLPLIKNGLAEGKDAIEYTNKALQISSDLFNTYGGSTEQYTTAINWALKGTFSYVDNLNLGIKGTQEGFIEAANSSGILGREIQSVSELTNDEIIDVIEYYAKANGAFGRTAQEASTTIQGSFNMMKASWSNLLTEFSKGGDLSKPIDQLIQSASQFTNNIIPIVIQAVNGIAQALPELITSIGDKLPDLISQISQPLVDGVVALLNALITALPTLILTLLPALLDGTKQLIVALAQALPQLIQAIVDVLPELITMITSMLPTLIPQVMEAISQSIIIIAQMLPTLLPQIVDAILEIIPILIDNLPLFIDAGWQLLMGLLEGIVKSIPKILAKIPDIMKSLINAVKNVFGIHSPSTVFADIGGNIMKGLWNGISGLKDWVINKVKSLGKSILKGLKSVLGIHSPSTEFAMIGKFSVLGYTEQLDKMKRDLQTQVQDTFGISPQLTGSMNSTLSPNVVVNNNISMETDPLGQMVSNIKTFSGGSKNDYNYGMGV